MKKRTLGAGVLTAMMLFSPLAGVQSEVSAQKTQQATQKIMWGKSEISATQIGIITFNTDVKIYKMINGVEKFHLVAKKGSGWRVHSLIKDNKNRTYYDLGGGVRVMKSNLSKFEAVPTNIVKKLVEKYGAKISWEKIASEIIYPQVSRLASKDAENKINNSIKRNAESSIQGGFTNTIGTTEYKVLENANNRLKITNYTTSTETTDIGYTSSSELTMIFNLTTGELMDSSFKIITQ